MNFFFGKTESNEEMETPCCSFHGKVGPNKIFNTLMGIKYNHPDGQESKNRIFCLGYGETTSDEDEAAQKFYERDFGEKFKSENPIFIPNTVNDTPRPRILRPMINNEGNGGQQDDDVNVEKNKVGRAFHNILTSLKHCVIIRGSNENHDTINPFDFLIVSKTKRQIFHIQVKTIQTDESIDEASLQLQAGQNFWKESIPFATQSDWDYFRVMSFKYEDEDEMPCDQCSRYVLNTGNNLDECLENLFESEKAEIREDTFERIMKFLLHKMYWKANVLNHHQLGRVIDKKSKPETVIFWTEEQFRLMNDPKYKMVALSGTFGTGKTILLKAKAKELIETGEKVVIIIFCDSSDETLMEKTIRFEFENFQNAQNATVIHFDTSATNKTNTRLREISRGHSGSNFFLDGYDNNKINEENLLHVFSEANHHRYLWIAYKSQSTPQEHVIEGNLNVFKMTQPLRFSANLIKTFQAYNGAVKRSWPPKDVSPLFDGVKPIILQSNPKTPLVILAFRVAEILKNQNVKTVIKINYEFYTIKEMLMKTEIRERLVFELDEFVKSENKILLLNSSNDHLLKGFEIPILVVFSDVISSEELNEEIFSRCNSLLVLVHEVENENNYLKRGQDRFLQHEIIKEDFMPDFIKTQIGVKNSNVLNYWNERRSLPINIRNRNGDTILMLACANNNEQLVTELLNDNREEKPDVDLCNDDGWTALHFAAKCGNIEIAKLLFNNRAKLDLQTRKNETALHLAVIGKHIEVSDLLLSRPDECLINAACQIGEGREVKTKTVLHLAAECNNINLVEKLLECKDIINIDIKDSRGKSAMDIARANGFIEIEELLSNHLKYNKEQEKLRNPPISKSFLQLEVLTFMVVFISMVINLLAVTQFRESSNSFSNSNILNRFDNFEYFFLFICVELIPIVFTVLQNDGLKSIFDLGNPFSFVPFLLASIKGRSRSAFLTDPQVRFLMDVNFSNCAVGFPLRVVFLLMMEYKRIINFSNSDFVIKPLLVLTIVTSLVGMIRNQVGLRKRLIMFFIFSFLYRILLLQSFFNFFGGNSLFFLLAIIFINLLFDLSSHHESTKSKISLAILSIFFPITNFPVRVRHQMFSVRSVSLKNVAINFFLLFGFFFCVTIFQKKSNGGKTNRLFQVIYPDEWVLDSMYYAIYLMIVASAREIWMILFRSEDRQNQETINVIGHIQQLDDQTAQNPQIRRRLIHNN